jgi:hypothetical protein
MTTRTNAEKNRRRMRTPCGPSFNHIATAEIV